MVLDAKALNWAGKNNIDTAKLKAAKVPIYGKWYFPEIPADVPLVNLDTGEQQVFAERMIAGEVIYVPAADLQRAGLAPEDFTVMHAPPPGEGPGRALRHVAPEPLLAMARPVGLPRSSELVTTEAEPVAEEQADLSGIHMPSASISPFVLAIGFCLVFFGLIVNPIIVVVGLVWMLAGAIAWIRVGLLEQRAAAAHAAEVNHE